MKRLVILIPVLAVLSVGSVTSCGNGDDDTHFEERNAERVEHYIRSDTYTRLVIEVDYVSGFKPTESVQEGLVTGLEPLLDKPEGIEVVIDEELSPRGEDYAWERDRLQTLADGTFDLDVDENTIKIHALFLDGHDARDDEDGTALGLSWANQNVVIYKQQLQDVCQADAGDTLRRQGLVERVCNETELIIWTHEVGHVFGLVNFGLPMVEDHEDPEHEYHDHNPDCVMYWAFERRQAFEKIGDKFIEDEDISLGFDEACEADIAAVRDR